MFLATKSIVHIGDRSHISKWSCECFFVKVFLDWITLILLDDCLYGWIANCSVNIKFHTDCKDFVPVLWWLREFICWSQRISMNGLNQLMHWETPIGSHMGLISFTGCVLLCSTTREGNLLIPGAPDAVYISSNTEIFGNTTMEGAVTKNLEKKL